MCEGLRRIILISKYLKQIFLYLQQMFSISQTHILFLLLLLWSSLSLWLIVIIVVKSAGKYFTRKTHLTILVEHNMDLVILQIVIKYLECFQISVIKFHWILSMKSMAQNNLRIYSENPKRFLRPCCILCSCLPPS